MELLESHLEDRDHLPALEVLQAVEVLESLQAQGEDQLAQEDLRVLEEDLQAQEVVLQVVEALASHREDQAEVPVSPHQLAILHQPAQPTLALPEVPLLQLTLDLLLTQLDPLPTLDQPDLQLAILDRPAILDQLATQLEILDQLETLDQLGTLDQLAEVLLGL